MYYLIVCQVGSLYLTKRKEKEKLIGIILKYLNILKDQTWPKYSIWKKRKIRKKKLRNSQNKSRTKSFKRSSVERDREKSI